MQYPNIRRVLSFLRHLPVHPQWFAFRNEISNLTQIGERLDGVVLDIGCSEQRPRHFLRQECHYIGLDYYETATDWYKTTPHVYGDAQSLPFRDSSVDSVLLLDVLEHLPQPAECFSEIKRVLKENGKFILQVPFIYPIHDAPLDFQRWTIYGLRELAHQYGFEIKEEVASGGPMETAALICNIAMGKTILNWLKQKNPTAVLVLIYPLFVFLFNILAWVLTILSPKEDMMPKGYRLMCVNHK